MSDTLGDYLGDYAGDDVTSSTPRPPGSIDYALHRRAIHAWVVAGSGLDPLRVLWADRNPGRPAGRSVAYISIRQRNVVIVANDWVVYSPNPLVLADLPVTAVDDITSELTVTAHGLFTGDGPVRLDTSGTLPAGLAIDTDYWVVKIDANTIRLATTHNRAARSLPFIADPAVYVVLSDAGTGVHMLLGTATTVRQGQELLKKTRGMRQLSFTITCFPPDPQDDTSSADAILANVAAYASDDDQSLAWVAARLGMMALGPITPLDGVVNSTRFEARAVLPVTFHAASEIVGYASSVENVLVEPTVDDDVLDNLEVAASVPLGTVTPWNE